MTCKSKCYILCICFVFRLWSHAINTCRKKRVILRTSLLSISERSQVASAHGYRQKRSGIVRHSYGFMPSYSWFNRSKDSDHTFTFLCHYISSLSWPAAVSVCSDHIKHHAGHCRPIGQILSCFDVLRKWHFDFFPVIHPVFTQNKDIMSSKHFVKTRLNFHVNMKKTNFQKLFPLPLQPWLRQH